jgi:hypothetical protein
MNLQEYLTSSGSQRAHVDLKDGEFTVGPTVKAGNDELTLITIPAFNYSYVIKNKRGYLYTMDSKGYPKLYSCFYIPFIIQTN